MLPEALRHLFTTLPEATSVEHYEALLPWNIDRSLVASIDRPRRQTSPAD